MTKTTHHDIVKEMQALNNPAKAVLSVRFFKTGKGQYGYGDKFLGLTVPATRLLARKYKHCSIDDLKILIKNPWHEIRLAALIIAVEQFKEGDDVIKRQLFQFYVANTAYINNWDLVDLSAHHIVGPAAELFDKTILTKLAQSSQLWEKRIAIVATFHFIRLKRSKETFQIADMLIADSHDLMHKAVGWMLREVGKRVSEETLEAYLKKHYHTMPRTTLRYAIERFSPTRRQEYLKGDRKSTRLNSSH